MTRARISPGRILLWGMLLGAVVIGVARFALGLGAVTNLSDRFPWGLWVGFDIMCGVALAAGGFTVAGLVYVLHLERYHPLHATPVVAGRAVSDRARQAARAVVQTDAAGAVLSFGAGGGPGDGNRGVIGLVPGLRALA